jgi:hypothetical protein
MGKKLLYVGLGLIVALIAIVKVFSNTHVKNQTTQIEEKVTQKIDHLFNDSLNP